MVPGVRRLLESELLVRDPGDFHCRLGNVPCLLRLDRKAKRRRIDDDETIAAPGDIQRDIKLVGKRGKILTCNLLGLAVLHAAVT